MLRRLTLTCALAAAAASDAAAPHDADAKLDGALRHRAQAGRGPSRIVVRPGAGAPFDAGLASMRRTASCRLPLPAAPLAGLPDAVAGAIASDPSQTALVAPIYALNSRSWGAEGVAAWSRQIVWRSGSARSTTGGFASWSSGVSGECENIVWGTSPVDSDRREYENTFGRAEGPGGSSVMRAALVSDQFPNKAVWGL